VGEFEVAMSGGIWVAAGVQGHAPTHEGLALAGDHRRMFIQILWKLQGLS
jgi:hypothetical protein